MFSTTTNRFDGVGGFHFHLHRRKAAFRRFSRLFGYQESALTSRREISSGSSRAQRITVRFGQALLFASAGINRQTLRFTGESQIGIIEADVFSHALSDTQPRRR